MHNSVVQSMSLLAVGVNKMFMLKLMVNAICTAEDNGVLQIQIIEGISAGVIIEIKQYF